MNSPVHLWQAWPKLTRRLAAAKHIFLFSDFDGTLAPIVQHPRLARLSRARRNALRALSQSSRVTLGIVSGRGLAELRRLVGLEGLCYVGSHGLEWQLPQGRPGCQATAAERRSIEEVAEKLRRGLAGIPGVVLEQKPVSLAVHYRNARVAAARRSLAQVAQVLRGYGAQLQVLRGKKVVELLPAGALSKGRAVQRLLVRLRPSRRRSLAIYMGDDMTDESVFAILRKSDVGIFVGRSRQTRARFYLNSPAQVSKFLDRLGQIFL